MKTLLIAAAAIVSLSSAAMADPVKLSSDRLGDVAGGVEVMAPMPTVSTNLSLAETNVTSMNALTNQDSALAIGLGSSGVGAGTTTMLSGMNTSTIGGGL